MEQQQQKRDTDEPSLSRQVAYSSSEGDSVALAREKQKEAELFQSLLKSVASNNISTLQQGLAKQSIYWSGVAWVAQALEQRLSGVAAGAIDLGTVTEKLASFVSVGDAGVIRDRDEKIDRLSMRQSITGDEDLSLVPNFDVSTTSRFHPLTGLRTTADS